MSGLYSATALNICMSVLPVLVPSSRTKTTEPFIFSTGSNSSSNLSTFQMSSGENLIRSSSRISKCGNCSLKSLISVFNTFERFSKTRNEGVFTIPDFPEPSLLSSMSLTIVLNISFEYLSNNFPVST